MSGAHLLGAVETAAVLVWFRATLHDAGPMFEPLRLLRVTALVEAVSYLVLLAIAMPLKWWWGMPLMVRIVGMAHGALFLLMIWFLLRARIEKDWPMARLRLIFLASLVPLWPFFLDRRMRVWCQEGDAPRPAS